MNDNGAYYGDHRSDIKVEWPVVVLPGRHYQGNGGLLQEIKGEFDLRE